MQCHEKIWTRTGPEFGSETGCIMIVVHALYGLKSNGAAFRALLSETLYDIGYLPTKADPDVWIWLAVRYSISHQHNIEQINRILIYWPSLPAQIQIYGSAFVGK